MMDEERKRFDIREVFERDDLLDLYMSQRLEYDGIELFEMFLESRGGPRSIFACFSESLMEAAWAETFYLAYSKEADVFVFGVHMSIGGEECEGYVATRLREGGHQLYALHLHPGDFVFGNVRDYARSRFADLKDLQLD